MKEQIKENMRTVRLILNTIPVKGEDVIRLGFAMQTIDRIITEVDKLEDPAEVGDDGGQDDFRA